MASAVREIRRRSCGPPLRKRYLDAAPQGDGELAAFEVLHLVDVEAGCGEPTSHDVILETEPNVRIAIAQLFTAVRGKVDDQQCAARGEHPRRLRNRRGWRMRIMQDLVDDDAVGTVVG